MIVKRLVAVAAAGAAAAAALAALTVAPANADADTWVAIAYSPATGAYGWANNAATKDEAVNLATSFCVQYGGTDCQLAAAASNACVALAVNDRGGAGGVGPTIAAAEQDAINERGGGEIQVSKCST